jgi:hypothetical protein
MDPTMAVLTARHVGYSAAICETPSEMATLIKSGAVGKT